jgi:hypothetical protein
MDDMVKKSDKGELETKNNKDKEEDKKMDFYRKTAIIVGALFIIATASTMVSIVFMGSSIEGHDYLEKIADNENRIILSVVFWIILAISVAGIGFFMYPILKKYHEGLAQGYVVFRLIETILILISAICLQSLLTLGQEFVKMDTTNLGYYDPSGIVLKAVFDWSFIIGTMIFLGLGGLILYYIVYKLKLVPSWLSLWGLIGAACVFLYGLISLFDYDPAILAAPIAVQEMVFAIWIIVKGFDTSEIDTK